MPRPPKIWVTSDWHINHEHMLVAGGHRPANYVQQLRNELLRTVAEQDTCYMLGDVIFRRRSYLREFMSGLPGKYHLIMGNHDSETPHWYQRAGFSSATSVLSILRHGDQRVCLVHKPEHGQPLLEAGLCDLVVHGHLHAGTHRDDTQWLNRPGYRLVSLELDGLTPTEL